MEKVVQQLRLPPLPVVAHEKVQYHHRRAVLGQAYYGLKENLTETQVRSVRRR